MLRASKLTLSLILVSNIVIVKLYTAKPTTQLNVCAWASCLAIIVIRLTFATVTATIRIEQ